MVCCRLYICGTLLTRINLNPSLDNNIVQYKVWDEISYPFPNFNDATVQVL